MRITKSAKAASYEMMIKKITMYRGADRVALFNTPSTNPTINNISSTGSIPYPFTDPGDSIRTFPNYFAWPDSLYTYENLCGKDTTEAVRFEIEVAVNSPTNIRTASFYLATTTLKPPMGDTTYNVFRNHWYDVDVNLVDPGLDSINITVIANRWNVVDPIEVISGHGAVFETAQTLRLVKNITASEWGTYPTNFPDAAIQSHSKGASWIDMTVTNDTPWQLGLKDNTPRNQGVYYSLDSATWLPFPAYPGTISGTGDDTKHRIFIYRWYREDDEASLLGPTLYARLSEDEGISYKWIRDFIIQPRDLKPFPTNSYVMRPQLPTSGSPDWPINETRAYIPLAGVYAYWENYLLDKGVQIPTNWPITTNLLWDDQGGGVVTNLRVIHDRAPDSAYIYAEAVKPGNAVVTMEVNGNIYWSFHLWVTEYNPYEPAGQKYYANNHKVAFMDRNLGALANEYDAQGNARGLFYQFGRKDPFPRGVNWTATATNAYSTQIAVAASSIFRPKIAIPASIHNPRVFYTRPTGNWTLSVEDSSLWLTKAGKKTAYDPCPEGWRVPIQTTNNPWAGPLMNTSYINSPINGFDNPILGYYPFSGYVNFSTGSGITGSATQTYVWTTYSINTSNSSQGFAASASSVSATGAIEKSYGASVRCVVDYKYLQEKGANSLFGRNTDNLLLLLEHPN